MTNYFLPKFRLPQLKDHHPQASLQNDTGDISEITFTTRKPEAAFSTYKTHSNLYLPVNKGFTRIRPGRSSIPPRLRFPNRYTGIRRRRQLQRSGVKSSHVGRSYDLSKNHIDSQHVETIQGPAEAFDDGAIHLEPVYRVTKNKNVFDSIIDVLQRMFDPPKSVGPLVGPFNFPGVGDKVYIRLLEPIRPDNLVVRLVTHLSAADVESVLDKDILPIGGLPLVDQKTIALPNEGLTNSHETHEQHHSEIHLIPEDSVLSSSSNVAQASKASPGRNSAHANSYPSGGHFRTYKIQFKPGEVNSIERVRYQKRNPSVISSGRNNHVSPIARDQVNETRSNPRAHRYPHSYDQVYQFHSPANATSKENFEPLTIDFHTFHDSINVSTPEVYNKSMAAYEAYPSFEIVNTQTPVEIDEDRLGNYTESAEDRPRYSIKFASKNMRYLNLDGSVESAITEGSNEGFRPMEMPPVTSFDPYWDRFRRMHVETSESSKDYPQERSGKNSEELSEVERKSSGEEANDSEKRNGSRRTGRKGSRCCSEEKDENKRTKSSYDEEQHGPSINNSASSVRSAPRNGSTNSLMLHRLQSSLKNSTRGETFES
ncbi:hypothetical protein WH47_11726 [Habropoda laboriosa]|uniref:Uncharacterized protein n=1 Tax=Habropoda laboriosa TaxID=597456 RepID=A0A0L7R8B4_9HYME|nr:hypothetical protein WH47_11726 [Habropoda laboriosa]